MLNHVPFALCGNCMFLRKRIGAEPPASGVLSFFYLHVLMYRVIAGLSESGVSIAILFYLHVLVPYVQGVLLEYQNLESQAVLSYLHVLVHLAPKV
jgi:hypothetical protein